MLTAKLRPSNVTLGRRLSCNLGVIDKDRPFGPGERHAVFHDLAHCLHRVLLDHQFDKLIYDLLSLLGESHQLLRFLIFMVQLQRHSGQQVMHDDILLG